MGYKEQAKERSVRIAETAAEAKKYLGFTEQDIKRLNELAPKIEPYIPNVVSYVVKTLGAHPTLLNTLETHPLPVETAVEILERWLKNVFSWNYGEDFGEQAYRIGSAHVGARINPKFMTLTMGNFVVATSFIIGEMTEDKKALQAYLSSIEKAFMLNLTLMLQSYEARRLDNFLRLSGMTRELYERMSSIPW